MRVMKEKILRVLRDAEGYVSGQELCEQLGVSRTAVWKIIGQLKEEGYQIEGVKNRGYRITYTPDVMTAAEIESRLNTKVMGRSCVCCGETDSTNTQAKRLAEEEAPHGTLICAERQTGGKGRRGRNWSSPSGEAIYMSLLLRPSIHPAHTSMLTIVMGLAAARACNEILQNRLGGDAPRVQVKWPNDLVLGGRKLAGILTELSTEIDYINYVVIGVGINVNTQRFPEEISSTAVSLYMAAGEKFSRAELTACCMKHFEICYDKFLEKESLEDLREEYESLLVNTGRQVRVLDPGKEYTGTALGIDQEGELLVECGDGQVKVVYAGEVSVRGIYGYV